MIFYNFKEEIDTAIRLTLQPSAKSFFGSFNFNIYLKLQKYYPAPFQMIFNGRILVVLHVKFQIK